jgi:hypothetical protein
MDEEKALWNDLSLFRDPMANTAGFSKYLDFA